MIIHRQSSILFNIIVTCGLPWCNLIPSLLPCPACSRGANPLGMRWTTWLHTCLHCNFSKKKKKKRNRFCFVGCRQKKYTFSSPRMGPLLKIFALGIPLHANVFSFRHNAVVLSQFRCVHPENQTKICWFLNFDESKHVDYTKSDHQRNVHVWFGAAYCNDWLQFLILPTSIPNKAKLVQVIPVSAVTVLGRVHTRASLTHVPGRWTGVNRKITTKTRPWSKILTLEITGFNPGSTRVLPALSVVWTEIADYDPGYR